MIPLHHITPHFPRSTSCTSFGSPSLDRFWIPILIYCCWLRISLLGLLLGVVVVVGRWWLRGWGRRRMHVAVGCRRQTEINCWRHLCSKWTWLLLRRPTISQEFWESCEKLNWEGIDFYYLLLCFGNMDDELTHGRAVQWSSMSRACEGKKLLRLNEVVDCGT